MDSPEEFDAFTATLMPILAIAHIDMAPPEPLELHDLVDGGESIAELRDRACFIRPIEKLLHSVKGKPSETTTLTKRPRARADSPPEHRPAGHVAIASHVERLLGTHGSLTVRSC